MVLFKFRKVTDKSTMLPSKSTVDYMDEISSFFPTLKIDGDASNAYTSPFHTPNANRYSSSTDSTSPELYFNISFPATQSSENYNKFNSLSPRTLYEANQTIYESHPFNHNSARNIETHNFNHNLQPCTVGSSSFDSDFSFFSPHSERRLIDTPFQAKQHRPIIGRKILGSSSHSLSTEPIKSEVELNMFQANVTHTPDKFENHYELFPSNNRSHEFRSPLEKQTDFTQNYTSSNKTSPPSSIMPSYMSPNSPTWLSRVQTSIPNFKPPFNPASLTGASSSSYDEIGPSKICMFCRKNGETPSVYMTHSVKEKLGRKYKVTCPILRSHVCSACGATGDDAHTITYCPVLRNVNNGKPLESTTITLKNTRIKSNGRPRY